MARCFCGCGRRLRFKGRIANVYGGNAQTLGEQIDALLDEEFSSHPGRAELSEEDLRSVQADLEGFRDGYREVVHGEKRLSEMEPLYDLWIATRNQAISMLAVAEQHAVRDPEARRHMALGDWLKDEGFPEDDPERVLRRMAEIGEDEIERILRGYEDRREDWSETGPLRAFRPDESESDAT
jgi:hypothetical protein